MTSDFELDGHEKVLLKHACGTADLIDALDDPAELRAQRALLARLVAGLKLPQRQARRDPFRTRRSGVTAIGA